MKDSIQHFCEIISAEEVDYILPLLAIISNPKGCLSIPTPVSSNLSFELVCYGGTATIHMEHMDCTLEKNQDLVITGPNKMTGGIFSNDFKGHIFALTIDSNNSIVTTGRFTAYKYYSISYPRNLSKDQGRQYYLYFEWLKYACRRNLRDAENQIRNLISASFYVFSNHEIMDERVPKREDMIVSKFMEILENDEKFSNSIEYYATRIHITKKCLARAVKCVTGLSPSHMITEQKVIRAKKMITTMHINSSLETVAEHLGFTSLSSFCRFFRSATGMTPSEFRDKSNL